VTRARSDRVFGADPLYEDVDDGVEGRAVSAGDYELRERREAKLVERNLGFLRRALSKRGAGAGLEPRR
jgi:hypothetical protein